MNRRQLCVLALASLIALALASPASAQERILSYDIEVEIREDGSLELVERIRVRAEGSQIRRGIYRDFPTRYRDRAGNRVRVEFTVLSVEKNGAIEPWFTESLSNGWRVNTGNDDFLAVPAEYEYTLRYRTTRQIGFFDDYDELYWNAIGTGWIFPIERASVVVRLPTEVPPDSMTVEAYTGIQDEEGDAYTAVISAPGTARYATTRTLEPREGLTIVLTFPKGILQEPTQAERIGWILKDNRGVLVACVGLILFLAYCARQWATVGRDPRRGVVIPRYEPRSDLSPAAHRYLMRMGYDNRALSGDILALAVGGHIAIHRDERLFKDDWTLERLYRADEPELESERIVLKKLFSGHRDMLVLRSSSSGTISGAQNEHRKTLDRALNPRYFKRNGPSLAIATMIAILTALAAFITSGGYGIPIIVAITVLMALLLVVFSKLIMAPTPEGREALDEIEGLKLYLSVAEKDELARLTGPRAAEPRIDAARYEALLPYAVALDVEEAWSKKFTLAVGAAAAAVAASHIAWYRGSGPISDLGSFGSSIGSSLSSTISSSSSPPGSSSGSGGGGSSGGGGGGGGGGGR
jgi:uncharacterized membrane protein YgcG